MEISIKINFFKFIFNKNVKIFLFIHFIDIFDEIFKSIWYYQVKNRLSH